MSYYEERLVGTLTIEVNVYEYPDTEYNTDITARNRAKKFIEDSIDESSASYDGPFGWQVREIKERWA